MNRKAVTGAAAAAMAMKQINPDVVPVYPITPQTPIAMTFAQYVADGEVDSEMIRVESEHSAMSAAVGASAAGARAMTATASAGLALMWEILGCASGCRLPIIMNVVNRALSAPINIHCDHSDSMGCRDHSWIQLYAESGQEVYDLDMIALRLSEHEKVHLPSMVMQDGFITSHGVGVVDFLEDKKIKRFIGEYRPKHFLLDVKNPVSIGPLALPDFTFEIKRQQVEAMEQAKKIYLDICKEYKKVSGREYSYFEKYMIDDAEYAIIVLNSTAGIVKEVVDKLREKGKKVGLLKPIMFRPFPYGEMKDAIKNLKGITVMDRSYSYGADAPLFGEIKNTLFDLEKKPKIQSIVFGIGGRNTYEEQIEQIFLDMIKDKFSEKVIHLGCR